MPALFDKNGFLILKYDILDKSKRWLKTKNKRTYCLSCGKLSSSKPGNNCNVEKHYLYYNKKRK